MLEGPSDGSPNTPLGEAVSRGALLMPESVLDKVLDHCFSTLAHLRITWFISKHTDTRAPPWMNIIRLLARLRLQE